MLMLSHQQKKKKLSAIPLGCVGGSRLLSKIVKALVPVCSQLAAPASVVMGGVTSSGRVASSRRVASSAGADVVPEINIAVAGAASVPSAGPGPVSVVVVSPAVAVLVSCAGGASICEIDHSVDDGSVYPVPASAVLLGGGGLTGGNEVIVAGTLGKVLLLAAAQGDQVGDQLGSGVHG